MSDIKLDELVQKYKRLRDIKALYDKENKEKTAKVKEAMQKIENIILQHFEATGQSSSKTLYGTPYISLRESYSVGDREAYMDWVRDNEAWEFLESRVSKSAVDAYKEDTGELPPGINYSAERKINVRS
jgi:hypothetical protein